MFRIDEAVLRKYGSRRVGAAIPTNNSLADLFHENTKLTELTSRSYGMRISQFNHNPILQRLHEQPFKVYSLMDREELSQPMPRNELESLTFARRSVRSYTGGAMQRDDLSRLLFFSYGQTEAKPKYRAVASGGAIYPLEIYVVALRIEGLERGIYHYNKEQHLLDGVVREDRLPALKEAIYFDTIDIDHAAALVIVTAFFPRMAVKYQDRGYRLILLEAGGLGHAMALEASALGLGTCFIGGFQDDFLSEILGIDGVEEAPLLPIAIGYPAPVSSSQA